jgi:glutamate receptor, ionotropic, plant
MLPNFIEMKWTVLSVLPLIFSLFSNGSCQNITSRPSIINIGAVFKLNSTIGEAANVAINAAVEDVNSDPNILNGFKLAVTAKDSNCSGFLGIIEGSLFNHVHSHKMYFRFVVFFVLTGKY